MTLRFLFDAARTQKRSLTVALVDYSKAFDSVDRWAIPVVLRLYGVPGPAVADVTHIGHGSTAAVEDSLLTYRNVRCHQWCSASGYTVASPLYPAGRLHSQTITRR